MTEWQSAARRVLWIIEMPKPQDGRFILTQIYSFHQKPLMLKMVYGGEFIYRSEYSPDKPSKRWQKQSFSGCEKRQRWTDKIYFSCYVKISTFSLTNYFLSGIKDAKKEAKKERKTWTSQENSSNLLVQGIKNTKRIKWKVIRWGQTALMFIPEWYLDAFPAHFISFFHNRSALISYVS